MGVRLYRTKTNDKDCEHIMRYNDNTEDANTCGSCGERLEDCTE